MTDRTDAPHAEAHSAADPAADQDSSPSAAPARPSADSATRYNKHDVGVLEHECNRLVAAINARGAEVELARLHVAAQAYAAIKLLVDHGLCTEVEAQATMLTHMRSLLASSLQNVEEAQLRSAAVQPGVQPVRKPGLILPQRHGRRHQD